MTNKDKYLREGVSVEEFITAFIKKENISIISLEVDQINHFLKSEVTPILTEDERVILRNMQICDETLETIVKDKNGDLYVTSRNFSKYISMYDHLFQFIKERRRILNKGVIEL